MKLIDDFLNGITMYKLVLYFLILLAGVGLIYSFFKVLPFDPISYIFSFVFLVFVAGVANFIFAKTFEAPINAESWIISALILGLIITPPTSLQGAFFLGWAAVLMVSTKFILAIAKKHIFNPVAASVVLTSIFIGQSASWWVGTVSMLPIITIGGFLVVRKIRRWDLVLSFLIAALITVKLGDWGRSITETPLIFFSVIMITEPLTTPPTRILRILYGVLIGLLLYFKTPEIAIVIGNIFSYIFSPKYKLILKLRQKIRLTPDTYDFVFATDGPINFRPGQYMEWTFEHSNPDSRGNRRYFTLASSPTEPEVRLGIKFGNPMSSYKYNLLPMKTGDKIAAGQLVGDFTLPKDPGKKLVFVAGGIGITPFRSMLKYLIDIGQRRNIVVIYTAKNEYDFVYGDILRLAQAKLGIRVIYNSSDKNGHLGSEELAGLIPDFRDRTFYLSGSHSMVEGFETILGSMGVSRRRIVEDYFPGFV